MIRHQEILAKRFELGWKEEKLFQIKQRCSVTKTCRFEKSLLWHIKKRMIVQLQIIWGQVGGIKTSAWECCRNSGQYSCYFTELTLWDVNQGWNTSRYILIYQSFTLPRIGNVSPGQLIFEKKFEFRMSFLICKERQGLFTIKLSCLVCTAKLQNQHL